MLIEVNKPDPYRVIEVREGGSVWYEVREAGWLLPSFIAPFRTRSKRKALRYATRKNEEVRIAAGRTETWL